MGPLAKIWSDTRGIAATCGPGVAARWLLSILLSAPQVLRERQLLAADRRMGVGPFRVRHKVGEALLGGREVFCGIREIWVRDAYGRKDFLNLPDNALVVDLGSNVGNFTVLALAANPTARVVAVEAHRELPKMMWASVRLNGFEDRLRECNAFIGSSSAVQIEAQRRPEYASTPCISEAEFLSRFSIDRIDYLKCDIEGSEFGLLGPESRLIDVADRLAIEIHHAAGDPHMFLDRLVEKGFRLVDVEWANGDCVALALRSADAAAQPRASS